VKNDASFLANEFYIGKMEKIAMVVEALHFMIKEQ
jgi:hypothetical protein